jgi:hypothetical protein
MRFFKRNNYRLPSKKEALSSNFSSIKTKQKIRKKKIKRDHIWAGGSSSNQ